MLILLDCLCILCQHSLKKKKDIKIVTWLTGLGKNIIQKQVCKIM